MQLFICILFFFLMIRRPPRSTLDRSSAASDVYKRQAVEEPAMSLLVVDHLAKRFGGLRAVDDLSFEVPALSLIHISEPTRPY